MRSHISFFSAGDGTAIGNLDQLQLTYIPKAVETIRFVTDGKRAVPNYTVDRVEHVLIWNFMEDDRLPFQQVDVYFRPTVV